MRTAADGVDVRLRNGVGMSLKNVKQFHKSYMYISYKYNITHNVTKCVDFSLATVLQNRNAYYVIPYVIRPSSTRDITFDYPKYTKISIARYK